MTPDEPLRTAERLARAIVNDIQLYNSDLITELVARAQSLEELIRGLDSQIQDGRMLFVHRVGPDLGHVYDEIVRNKLGDRLLDLGS